MFPEGCEDWGISLDAFIKDHNIKRWERKKRLYYNPIELPSSIKFVKDNKVWEITEDNCFESKEINNPPLYLDQLFKEKEQYDNIIVELCSHNEAYYWSKKNGEDVLVPVSGEISLYDFSDGGGYLKDKKRLFHKTAFNNR